jgi:aminopeptidase YwaD
MLGEIWSSKTLWPTMQTLCDDCNGRFVASEDERKAAAYICEQFASYGLTNAHTEEFDIPGWKRGPASLIANGTELVAIGLPGTIACDLTAPLINVGNGEPADFEKVGEAARGKIAFVRGQGSHRLEKYARAVKAGCVGFVFSAGEVGMLPATGSLNQPAPIPGAGIAYETYLRLDRMSKRGELTGRLVIQADLFPATGLNVVADLLGAADADPAAGLLMVCGHYDGHDIAQGAVDNASGTAAVMEIGRAMKIAYDKLEAAGQRPAIGMRFIGFSGEEVGMVGSSRYADAHPQDVARVKLVYNIDIAGNPGGLFLGLNGYDIDRVVEHMRAVADSGYELNMRCDAVIPYSDHFSFYLKGVAALMAGCGGSKYQGMGPHTYGDTLDKVDLRGIRTVAAYAATVLLGLACDPARLPSRQNTIDELREILKKAGYEEKLKA